MRSIRTKSYAKINLTLDVLGTLENGYHELEMIMQQVNLYDDVLVRWKEEKEGDFTVTLKTNRKYLPVDERNLAYKAALLMKERYGKDKKGSIRIDIGKSIPVAAGLAGGSGNGGAVVLAINSLWDLNLSGEELLETGKLLGSDVPFTMMGMIKANSNIPEYLKESKISSTAAIATYDGTVLEPVSPLDAYVVLSKPAISVSTAEVYKNIDSCDISKRPDTKLVLKALEEGNTELVAENMVNVLEFYSAFKYNCIMYTLESMKKSEGLLGSIMSGSGPTVFGIFDLKENAEKAFRCLKKINKETYIIRTSI